MPIASEKMNACMAGTKKILPLWRNFKTTPIMDDGPANSIEVLTCV
jgi:hypothetical protein